jgi:hypothetical protein
VVLMQVRYQFDKHRETPYRHKFYVSDYEVREWDEIVAWCETNIQPHEDEIGRIWFAHAPWIVVRDAQHAAKLKLVWC